MPPLRLRRRAGAYVTRRRGGAVELLVVTPLELDQGPQVPGGGIAAGEEPAAALAREVEEETGLAVLRVVRELGTHEWATPWGVLHRTTFFEVECAESEAVEWQHVGGGDGDDRGALFGCRWHRLPLGFPLFGEQDAFLPLLEA